MIDTSTGPVLNAASGALLAVIGIWVWRKSPRAPANATFGVFATVLGILLIPENMYYDPGLPGIVWVKSLVGVGWLAAAAALLILTRLLPHRRPQEPPRIGRNSLIAVSVLSGVLLLLTVLIALRPGPLALFPEPFQTLMNGTFLFASTGALIVWAARANEAARRGESGHVREFAFVSLGVGPFAGIGATSMLYALATTELTGWTIVLSWAVAGGLPLFACAMWVWTAASLRETRRIALTVVALFLASGVVQAVWFLEAGGTAPTWGIGRILGVGILGYAILRYHVLDIELKLKWSISKATVATIFAAVFAIVGLSASEFLVDEYGYGVGAVAAGLLLIVLKPLQRFGENVAERALPRVQDTDEYRLVRKREVYEAAYQSAIRDGSVTEKERDMLAILQEQLGLKPTEARAIERAASS